MRKFERFLVGACALLLCAAATREAQAAKRLAFYNFGVIGWDANGFNNFSAGIERDIETLVNRGLNLSVERYKDGGGALCARANKDLCVVFDNTPVSQVPSGSTANSKITGLTSRDNWTSSVVYVQVVKQLARQLDGRDYGPSFGQLLKNVVLHELTHHAGRTDHASGSTKIMASPTTVGSTTWEPIDEQWFAGYFGLIPTSTGGGSYQGGTAGGAGVPEGVWFNPPWGSPYVDYQAIDAPFDPGCSGQWTLTFDYEFENGYDFGHLYRHDNQTTEVVTGSGSRSYEVVGATHWAIFTDYSIVARGFTNVRAVCH